MNTPDLHIVIATEQNIANLIPALQCQAKEVWVLQTPKMKERHSPTHLADALRSRGIEVHRLDFVDNDVAAMHAQAERLAARVGTRPVTINFTGGTKPMALALVQTLGADLATRPGATAPHLVYCDTANRKLDWLAPTPRMEPMQAVLEVEDILLAQGYRIVNGSGGAKTDIWMQQAQARSQLTRWLGENSSRIGAFFASLNAMACAARPEDGRPFTPQQQLRFVPTGYAAEVLGRLHQAGLIDWQAGQMQVQFLSEQAAEYLSGGWMEEFAALKLRGAHANGGYRPRLQIEQVDTKTRNELDAVLVHDNRMLVLECKSATTHGDISDWIYKLAQLARAVGGQMATPLLLCARSLNDTQRARAKEYRVEVLSASELRTLPDYLRAWMSVP